LSEDEIPHTDPVRDEDRDLHTSWLSCHVLFGTFVATAPGREGCKKLLCVGVEKDKSFEIIQVGRFNRSLKKYNFVSI
jgi:hypothetical protein